MDNILMVNAYKCPYCNKISERKIDIVYHMGKCVKNPNLVQKCSTCIHRYDYADGTPCFYTGKHGSGCPYVKHVRDI